jgi:hypothetical protein
VYKRQKEHNLPGIIFATDYDIGLLTDAWYDVDYQTLHVSTGEYTAWNQGYLYRNDGVDIEVCSDEVSNGYNIGWINDGEWLRFSLSNVAAGYYDITFRVAASSGKLNMKLDNQIVSPEHLTTPSTGGYQSWQDMTMSNVFIDSNVSELTLYLVKGGMNLNYIKFDLVTPTADKPLLKDDKPVITRVQQTDSEIKIILDNLSGEDTLSGYIELIDANGKVIQSQTLYDLVDGPIEIVFNQPQYRGLYIVRLVSHTQVITKKLMV